jgi:penicillin-binding protein 2
MENAKSQSGVAIVMNVKTGEILGMVSLPSFDNNLFASGISTEDYLRLSIDKSRPLVNHAVGGQYPPGSIFKVIPASVALQEGVVDTKQQFICHGTMYLPNRYFPDDPDMAQPFYCWNREGHGPIALLGALAFSCDIYFYQLGGGYGDFQGIGLETLASYANAYGLGAYTGVDLPGESKGLIPSAKWKRLMYHETWVTGDTYNMTIGQGFVLTTPLQMLNATAAIANNGTLYRPQVVREVVDSLGSAIRPFQPEIIRQIPISAENLAIVREGMRLAVTEGTAKDINLPQVTVAGKTGSAEFPGPRDYKGRLPTHAWFTAFAPYEDPQVALVVFVQGGGEGSLVSVPIAAEILNYVFPAAPDNSVGATPPLAAPTGASAATTAITTTSPVDATPTPKPTPVPAPFKGFWR